MYTRVINVEWLNTRCGTISRAREHRLHKMFKASANLSDSCMYVPLYGPNNVWLTDIFPSVLKSWSTKTLCLGVDFV